MPKDEGAGFRLVILLVITFLCLGISLIQMSRGYREFGGIFISGIFSFVVVLILFYLIFELHKSRRQNKSVWTIMAWYMFFVLVSFAGNFNAFYTFFMKNELLKTEVNQKNDALHQLRAQGEIALFENKNINKSAHALLSDLDSQIKSKDEPGCGRKCRQILDDVARELGRRPFTVINSRDNEYLAKEYRKIIVGKEETELLAGMDRDIAQLQTQVDSALKAPDLYALQTVKDIVEKYNSYAINIRKLAGDKFKGEIALAVENAEIGRMSQTFNSAFEHLSHWGTWLSAFAALMIDLFVPLFVLGFTIPSGGRTITLGKRGAENLS
jgi:hypothetical protein